MPQILPGTKLSSCWDSTPLLGTHVCWSGCPGILLVVLPLKLPGISSHHQTFDFQEHCTITYAHKQIFLWAKSDILMVVFWLYDLDDKILAFFPELINSFTVILYFFFLVFSFPLSLLSICCCLLYLLLPSCWQTSLQTSANDSFFSVSSNQVFLSWLQHISCYKVLVWLYNWSSTHM